MARVTRILSLVLVLASILTVALPVSAYLYRAPVSITGSSTTSYDMLPVVWSQDNTWLASNGFMSSTAMDTRVQTLGGLNKPWMVADDRTLTAIPVDANLQTNLYFRTGESPASAMNIITGYGGYFTVADDAALEIGNNGAIRYSGYIDTNYNKTIVSKGGGDFNLQINNGDIVTSIKDATALSSYDISIDYGGAIYSIWGDDTYIYAGGHTANTVKKYLKSDLSDVATSGSYGGAINSIWGDDTYIYVGGYNPYTVKKYLKSDLSDVAASDSYGGVIRSIWGDDTYIYVGGVANTVKKYLKSNLSNVATSANYGSVIYSIWGDDTYIYVGGDNPYTVKKYLKSDLSDVAASDSYGGAIRSIWGDDTYIYVGGYNPYTVKKYLKSNLSNVATSDSYGGAIYSIWGDDTYIYVGGDNPYTVKKYLKSDLSNVATSGSYGGAINSIWGDDTYIYVGAVTKVYRHVLCFYYSAPVDSGDTTIELLLDTSNIVLSINDVEVDTWSIDSSINNNTQPWIVSSSAYINYFEIDVAGTTKARYQPTSMVHGTTYSTGTVTVTNGSAAVTGTDTIWTDSMEGSVFVSTDGKHYVVAGVTDNTHLELSANYAGATLSTQTYHLYPCLPNETTADTHVGAITWGANPAGVTVTVGGMTSSGQADVGGVSDTSTSDILPVVGGTDWRPDPGVSPALQTNPLRPIVVAVSDNTTLSEYQVWVLLGIVFVIFVTVLVGANVRGHHLITGIAASGAIILLVVWDIFPLLSLIVVVFAIWGGLVSERSPSL